ncbi:unnamed protein product [Acanthosepion pharaonis]|uniref:Uncharacterized protein n=1 Tax=Acanthosepion pharaonis TaxID=158019 RepID=A0A812BWB2_ACAPH|nr:unnamed protein product [Sepia pharaonis]
MFAFFLSFHIFLLGKMQILPFLLFSAYPLFLGKMHQFIAVFFPHVFLSNLPLSVHIFLHLPRYPPWFIVIALYIPSSVHIYLSLFIPFYLDSYLLHYIKQAEVYVSCLFISISFPSYLPIMVYSLYVVFSYLSHSLHIMLQDVLASALNDNAVLSLFICSIFSYLPHSLHTFLSSFIVYMFHLFISTSFSSYISIIIHSLYVPCFFISI